MPLSGIPAPNKRKRTSRIITDLSHITQDEYESEPEASEFDLGTKIKVPKDLMLEELNLLKNKGSKMFKMRQKRVEKFIYENNPDFFSNESMENFQKLVPSLGGQMMDAGGQTGHLVVRHAGGGGHAPVPPPKPAKGAGSWHAAGGHAGGVDEHGHSVIGLHGVHGEILHEHGHGGQGVETALQKTKKRRDYVKTYISPWERAMKGNEELTATMKSHMPGPCVHTDLPRFKCFNRSAMPYGGFEKGSQLMTFQLPDIEVPEVEPEPAVVYQTHIGSRPSFNRTPIGWVGSGEPTNLHMELDTMPFDGETDDL